MLKKKHPAFSLSAEYEDLYLHTTDAAHFNKNENITRARFDLPFAIASNNGFSSAFTCMYKIFYHEYIWIVSSRLSLFHMIIKCC